MSSDTDIDKVNLFSSDKGENGQELGFECVNMQSAPQIHLIYTASAYSTYLTKFFSNKHNIKLIEWRMIGHMIWSPGTRVQELAKIIHVDHAAVSRTFKSLEERGLAHCKADETDLRSRRWYLTERGEEFAKSVMPDAIEANIKPFEGFDKDELELFVSLLNRVSENLK